MLSTQPAVQYRISRHEPHRNQPAGGALWVHTGWGHDPEEHLTRAQLRPAAAVPQPPAQQLPRGRADQAVHGERPAGYQCEWTFKSFASKPPLEFHIKQAI